MKLASIMFAVAAFVGMGIASNAAADPVTLFYGGDVITNRSSGDLGVQYSPNYESRSSDHAADGSHFYDRTYGSFTVPDGQSWQVTSLFANIGVQSPESIGAISQARYDIRSGVSAGDGGTQLFSGVIAAAATATGQMIVLGGTPVARLEAALASPITLDAGDYWLAFTPLSQTQNRLIMVTTDGGNAIDASPGNDFRDTNYFPGVDFVSTANEPALGLIGDVEIVPAPATLPLLLAGLGLLLASGPYCRRRRSG